MEKRLFLKMPTQNWLLALFSLIGAFLLFPAFFEANIYPIQHVASRDHLWISLDPSWSLALNHANNIDVVWGKDFAFTYGPLGHLATRIGWGANKYVILLFDLFVALNFFCLFYLKVNSSRNKAILFAFSVLLLIVLPDYFGTSIAIILFGFLAFWVVESMENNTVLSNIMQVMLLILLFYIKFNTGVISFVIFFIALLYKLFTKRQRIVEALAYLVLLFAGIFILTYVFNVALKEYLLSGLEIISGYNDAMVIAEAFNLRRAFAILIMFVPGLILVYKGVKDRKQLFKWAAIAAIYGISLFVLYKQAYVRADEGHVLEFFKYSMFLTFCVFPFTSLRLNKYMAGLLIIVFVLPAGVLYAKVPNHYKAPYKLEKHYISGFTNFTYSSGLHLFPNDNQIPDDMKKRIGKATVDVFPWNIHMLFENRLNYLPRPVMQSYSAYTPYLANKNFEHYNSAKGPQFVLYDYAAIDGRYPMFDDAKVNIVLQRNYNKIASFNYKGRDVLLLEKKKEAKPVTFVKTDEYAMRISSPLIPKENVYYEVVLYDKIRGKAYSVIDHAPDITLEAGIKDQLPVYFKTSHKILESGLFGTRLVQDIKHYNNILAKEQDSLQQISYYAFRPVNVNFFKDKIRVREYKIN